MIGSFQKENIHSTNLWNKISNPPGSIFLFTSIFQYFTGLDLNILPWAGISTRWSDQIRFREKSICWRFECARNHLSVSNNKYQHRHTVHRAQQTAHCVMHRRTHNALSVVRMCKHGTSMPRHDVCINDVCAYFLFLAYVSGNESSQAVRSNSVLALAVVFVLFPSSTSRCAKCANSI